MSPEYVIDGHYSVKSDVFSFGVLLLEIVSGKKNRGFSHPDHHHNLLGHVSRKNSIVLPLNSLLQLFLVFVKDNKYEFCSRHGCCGIKTKPWK